MADRDFDYINKTAYSIESVAVRSTWAGYCLFVIASSLIGDTTILIASIKYRAFKLHRTIVAIIQHIAFCDLMVSAMDIFPRFVTIVANDWVLGDFLCYFTAYSKYYFNTASLLLLCTLTSCKCLILKYPLQLKAVSSRKAHYFCAVCWFIALIFPITFLLVDRADIYASFRDYQCIHAATSEIWQWLKLFLAIMFLFLPTCLVVACTIRIMMLAKGVARRGRTSLKWQGTITILLTGTVYSISILPFFAYNVGATTIDAEENRFFYVEFYRLAMSLLCFNTISNFYIYSLTVHSFRQFVLSRLSLPLHYLTSIATSSLAVRY